MKKNIVSELDVETIDIPNMTITRPALYTVEIRGIEGILFNRMTDQSKTVGEKKDQAKLTADDKERLNWRDKLYFDDDGMIYIPGENIHECMKGASKYWGQRIVGEGKKTYTDVISKAVVCENLNLGIHKDSSEIIPFGKSVNGNPSKGKKSGAKVYRIRPLLRPWGGSFQIHVFDGRLTESVLRVVLGYASVFIGLCDWRPQFGRFEIVSIDKH